MLFCGIVKCGRVQAAELGLAEKLGERAIRHSSVEKLAPLTMSSVLLAG